MTFAGVACRAQWRKRGDSTFSPHRQSMSVCRMLLERTRGLAAAAKLVMMAAAALAVAGAARAADSSAPPSLRKVVTDTTNPRSSPEYERRWNPRSRPVGSSRRVDETYIHKRLNTRSREKL